MSGPRVLLIGSTGMIGSAVFGQLAQSGVEVIESSRNRGLRFDAEQDSCYDLITAAGLTSNDFVVNCVGLTKSHIRGDDPVTIEKAVQLNVLFPLALARATERLGVRVIQVATDCVFSGQSGKYVESSSHDALDIYGKSKSLGEVRAEHILHLRCSLVGPERRGRNTLFFEWIRALKRGEMIDGYIDHIWNGLTSQAFGAIVAGLIKSGRFFSGVQHLVPADSLTKYELVNLELGFLERGDVLVRKVKTGNKIDRSLKTINPDINQMLFNYGGFSVIPTIADMMKQLPWEELRNH